MKSLIGCFCFAFLFCAVVWAQNADSSNGDITLRIIDKKGRPVRGIVAQSLITGMGGTTDRSGRFVFANMSDSDTIIVKMTRNGQISIPVAGMDSILVMAESSKFYSYIDNQGQSVRVETTLFERSNILDVQALLKIKSYNTLTDLIRQEAPHALVTGPTTVTSGREPLVVLDGTDIGYLSEANYKVAVQSIKTLEVQRNGMGWGVRGTNGVILIQSN